MVTVLAIVALGAVVACVGALVSLHVLPTGYDPLRDEVSDYGVGAYRRWYAAQTTANAVAAVAVAGALAKAIDPVPRRVIVLLLVFAAARVVIPFFPTDLDRARRTGTGIVHVLLAVVRSGRLRGRELAFGMGEEERLGEVSRRRKDVRGSPFGCRLVKKRAVAGEIAVLDQVEELVRDEGAASKLRVELDEAATVVELVVGRTRNLLRSLVPAPSGRW